MGQYIWMRVSDDEYELPEVIGNSASDLARKCGKTKSTIITAITNAEQHGYKSIYKRVPVMEDEEEE